MGQCGTSSRMWAVLYLVVVAEGDLSAPVGATAQEAQQFYEAGEEAIRQRRPYEAEEQFVRCLEIDSTFCDAYVRLAWLYFTGNFLGKADSILAESVRRCPDRVDTHFLYSELLSSRGRRGEAYGHLKRVLELRPDAAGAYMGIGKLRMARTEMMDLQEAEEAFSRAAELDAENGEAAFELGRVRLSQGRWGAAARAFRRVVEQNPLSFPGHYQLGMTRYLEGAYTEAVSELRRAADLSPGSLFALWGLRLAYDRLGGYPADLPALYRIELVTQETRGNGGVRLTDVAGEVGVDRGDAGRGSAWADYDGDGDLDLFTMGHFGGGAYYRNDGEAFVERTERAGVAGESGVGCCVADYDNDGDPDLYIARNGWLGKGANSLLRNDGSARFTEVGAAVGVEGDGTSFTACWGDVDNDGHVDLFVANGAGADGSPNRLYHSDGQGGFRDVAAKAGIVAGKGIGSAFGDYDNDGDLDLYVANYNAVNTLYRNGTDSETGGIRFADVTRESRTQLPVRAYFAFFFDYDNDGDLDLFCSQLSDFSVVLQSKVHGGTRRNENRPALYRNKGDGSFADVTYAAGLGKSFGTTGAQYGDFNSDGYPDIYLGNGVVEVTQLEPDAMLLNMRDGTFVDIAAAVGVDQLGKGRGISFADYDGDGDEDMYVPVGGSFPGDLWENRLFRNDGPPHSWLTLRLVGVRSNRDGIGARVRVRAGEHTQYATVSGGGGPGSANSLQLELGLGLAEQVEELEIRWPSGQIDVHGSLLTNRMLILTEGEPAP